MEITQAAALRADSAILMSATLGPSLVRIKAANGAISGAGFLVSETHIITCAHVVSQALELHYTPESSPEGEVHIDFPFLNGAQGVANIETWEPIAMDGSGDVAVLNLKDRPPAEACAAPLLSGGPLVGRRVEVYGFPEGNDTGVYAYGVLGNMRANKSVQIEDTKTVGLRIQPGFSGAPVWDMEARGVVGMVVTEERDPSAKVAFMLPEQLLSESRSDSWVPSIPLPISGALSETTESIRRRSRLVGQGLFGLMQLMQSTDVYKAVSEFQSVFRGAREQITLVADLKSLHDALHRLQHLCFDPIVQQERRFPDEMAIEILRNSEVDLQWIQINLEEIVNRPSIQTDGNLWISNLSKANESLKMARQEKDKAKLQSAKRILHHILALEPSRVNTRLYAAAGALRLEILEKTMRVLQEKLKGNALESSRSSSFGTFSNSIDNLHTLNNTLRILVNLHDHSQRIDSELRRLEVTIPLDFDELEYSWQELKGHVESVCQICPVGVTNQWAAIFREEAGMLQTIIEKRMVDKQTESFLRFRRSADNCFFYIDASLNTFCGELRIIGNPLSDVLDFLSDSGRTLQ